MVAHVFLALLDATTAHHQAAPLALTDISAIPAVAMAIAIFWAPNMTHQALPACSVLQAVILATVVLVLLAKLTSLFQEEPVWMLAN